ncbi:Kri1_C domain-containing protein, partial [Cephalotus follicularis]
ELDESHTFLKEFFRNKMWDDKEKKHKRVVIDDEEVDEVLIDEEEIEMQEEYESNFRYAKNMGDRVMGHSRRVEGSVRKNENARKDQRKSKEDKMKIAEMEREEHLKHLKNLKKQEIKGDLKTSFKYAKLKPNRYGLSTAEILMMEEKELNQYVPLKKLAPYIEREWKVDKNKRYQQKLKNKELGEGGKLDGHKSDKKKRFRDGSDQSTSATGNEHRKVQMEESNSDDGNLSS